MLHVKVGSQPTARSHAMVPPDSSRRIPSTSMVGRISGSPLPPRKSSVPANSTAERAPRWRTPIACNDASPGWMHGRESQ
jgi:hypothetical protein